MRPHHPWLKKCVQRLNQLPQIHAIAITEPYYDEDKRLLADGRLTLTTTAGKIDYIFVIKTGITVDSFASQLEYLELFCQQVYLPQRPLLIVDRLSDSVGYQLIEKNIEFIDSKGLIYLNNDSHYILVQNIENKKQKPSNRLTVNGLKLMFIILQEPQRLQKYDRARLGQLAGINIKSVSQTLEILHRLHYLKLRSNQKYTVANYLKLFERWELGYIEILRNTLFLQAYRLLKPQSWSDRYDAMAIIKAENILIGGEWGADLLTQYLRSSQIVLHLPDVKKIQPIMLKLRLVPDPEGNIVFLRQFGQRNHWWLHETMKETPVVDPLLIHAELSLNPDARLKEVAQIIYEKYILPRQKRAEMM